jgi:CheY-like chemotaxis protein
LRGDKKERKMGKKVLIVDDEEDVRTYLNSLLSNNGYDTKIAVDGEDGFQKVNEFYPDIIILDIIMPNQSGVGFYRKLKKSEAYKDIPVIFLSAVTQYKDFFARERNSVPQPQAFIEKPFSPQDLLEKIATYIK